MQPLNRNSNQQTADNIKHRYVKNAEKSVVHCLFFMSVQVMYISKYHTFATDLPTEDDQSGIEIDSHLV